MLTNVYVDGFNLFYGALKGTPHKWLDLDALCRRLLPSDDVQRIRYFTARVSARPSDPHLPTRQQAYLRALLTIPHLTVHEGEFYVTYPTMALYEPTAAAGTPSRFARVIKTEEKGSDVNIATYLMLDACRGDCGGGDHERLGPKGAAAHRARGARPRHGRNQPPSEWQEEPGADGDVLQADPALGVGALPVSAGVLRCRGPEDP